jgi:hypothetical protein
VITGKENTTEYQFGRKFNGSPFCKTCGVHAFQNLYGPPKEVIDSLPEEKKAFVRKKLAIRPLNIRVLDGLDLATVHINRSNEGTEGYSLPE